MKFERLKHQNLEEIDNVRKNKCVYVIMNFYIDKLCVYKKKGQTSTGEVKVTQSRLEKINQEISGEQTTKNYGALNTLVLSTIFLREYIFF